MHHSLFSWWVKWKSLSCVRLFVTPWTVVCQAPLSMEFSRQGYWSGLPFPSPGDLPNPGMEPSCPALQADFLPSEPPGKSTCWRLHAIFLCDCPPHCWANTCCWLCRLLQRFCGQTLWIIIIAFLRLLFRSTIVKVHAILWKQTPCD